MRLTLFSDFGMRALMYLSQHQRDLPITISEIAGQFDVPRNHLVKVVNRLVKLGFVTAVRGRNGGLRLTQSASALRLGDVLRGLEGNTELVDCNTPPCVLRGRCLLSGALHAGLSAFYNTMDEFTLADVCVNPTGQAIVTLHRHYLDRPT